MAESGRKNRTLPSRTSSFAVGHGTKTTSEDLMASTRNGASRGSNLSHKKHMKSSPIYARVRTAVFIE